MPENLDEKARWRPLEARLPVEECTAFMYMGNDGDIHRYKHADTGRYLYLDEKSDCFVEDVKSEGYVPADFAAEYGRATNWGTATNWGQANAFETALSEAVKEPRTEVHSEPGGGMER